MITRAVTDIGSVSAVAITVPVDGLLPLLGVDLFFDIVDCVFAILFSVSRLHSTDPTSSNRRVPCNKTNCLSLNVQCLMFYVCSGCNLQAV